MLYCSTGNSFGVGIAASVPVLLYCALERPVKPIETIFLKGAFVFAGALHGMFLGYFQNRVLPQRQLKISLFEWNRTPPIASIIGWFLIILSFLFIANPKPDIAKPGIIQNFPARLF